MPTVQLGNLEKKTPAAGAPASKTTVEATVVKVESGDPLVGATNTKQITPSLKKLPLSNNLMKYSSYTYNITLFAIDTQAVNSPGKKLINKNLSMYPIICKSAGAAPSNRVKTSEGRMDFYLDDFTITSIYGQNYKTGNSNATDFEFTIYEPYSMGMFMMAMQAAGKKMGYENYALAAYCLKLEFKGADSNGIMSTVPQSTRYFPIRLKDVSMNVSEGGATYKVTALPIADTPLLNSANKITSNLQFSGSTVQEALQTGPKSLQKVLNDRLRDSAKANNIPIADEVVILFPTEMGGKSTKKEDTKETVKPAAAPEGVKLITDTGQIFSSLGVSRSSDNLTLIQETVNAIGACSLGYGPERPGITINPATDFVYDPVIKSYDQSKINRNVTSSNNVVAQNSTITNAIDQLILSSDYAVRALRTKPNDKGMRPWWKIRPELYEVDTTETMNVIGRKPFIYVYKIEPIEVLASALPKTGASLPKSKYDALQKNAVKVYNYIYTGRNTEILKINLEFDNMFQAILAADGYAAGAGAETQKQNATGKIKQQAIQNKPGVVSGAPGRAAQPAGFATATNTGSDYKGGGGADLPEHRAAKLFQDGLLRGIDMNNLEMEIVGDPYWVSGSAMGNWIAPSTEHFNLCADGSVNYMNGEVDMVVNFSTMIDVDSGTGLYKKASSKATQMFRGLYKVNDVISKFHNGEFTQTIKSMRRQISYLDTAEIVADITETKPQEDKDTGQAKQ